MRNFIPILIVLISFTSSAEEVVYLNDEPAKNTYPFSKATQVGQVLYLSGELGVDPKTGKLAPGGIVPETKQLMTNISNTLNKYNSDLGRVAKCTVFLADIKEWPQFNEVYRTFLN